MAINFGYGYLSGFIAPARWVGLWMMPLDPIPFCLLNVYILLKYYIFLCLQGNIETPHK